MMEEDYSKYVFDPQNPRAFKAYGLLKKILQSENLAILIDEDMFFNIFEEEIFHPEMVSSIWDMPEDFKSMNVLQKKATYIKAFSEDEFNEELDKVIYKSKNQNSLISKVVSIKGSLEQEYIDEIDVSVDILAYKVNYESNNIHDLFKIPEKLSKNQENFISGTYFNGDNRNFIFSINVLNRIIENIGSIEIKRSSIVIINKDNENLYNGKIKEISNIRPIIYHDYSDIKKLFKLMNFETKENNYKLIPKISRYSIYNYMAILNKKIIFKNCVFFLAENGEGKTLLLQAIMLGLMGKDLPGEVVNYLKEIDPGYEIQVTLSDGSERIFTADQRPPEPVPGVLAYGVSRFRNDSDQVDKTGFLTLFNHNQYLDNPIKWLQFLDYKEKSGSQPPISLDMAKALLEDLLEKRVSIHVSPDAVTFTYLDDPEPRRPYTFNQLSEGYRMVLVWVCDMVKRLAEQQQVAALIDLHGIVLVDELELFLHPKWQYDLPGKLRAWFPNIQFIFTTHSPVVLMGAPKESVFYRLYKEQGETRISEPYTYDDLADQMANGILTSPLFGLESAGMRESTARDTSDDFLYSRIHKKIREQLQQKREDRGTSYFSQDEIDQMIAAALAAEDQAAYGHD